jgi:hypothetical protein
VLAFRGDNLALAGYWEEYADSPIRQPLNQQDRGIFVLMTGDTSTAMPEVPLV